MTISFSATSPITIPNTSTNSTGDYLVSGLVSPSTTGSYNIKALFATTSLYAAVNSTVQTLAVTPAPTTLTLNSISSPAWGKSITVTGQLTITSSAAGIGGKTITFSGNGTRASSYTT